MKSDRAGRLVAVCNSREDALRRELAAAAERVSRALARLRDLRAELYRRRRPPDATRPAGDELARTEAYIERLRLAIARQQTALARAEEELSRARRALAEAGRERLAAQRLLAREHRAQSAREAAQEQHELDEATGRAHPRRER